MHYYVYILYSEAIQKYYIGYSFAPEQRLEFHNSSSNKIWSKRGQPWVLQYESAQKDGIRQKKNQFLLVLQEKNQKIKSRL